MIEKKDIKFIESFDISEWEVETDDGWKDIQKIGKTIPYERWDIVTESGKKLSCADEHLLFNIDGKEQFVKELKPNDTIMIKSSNNYRPTLEKLLSIQNSKQIENMFDMQVSGHKYYTNEILSHNTLWLINIATELISTGCNVLYISMEIEEREVIERIDGNLFDMNTEDLPLINEQKYKDKISGLKAKNFGKLIVKEYPTSSANVNHVRALLDELKIKKGFTPDFIILDYLNICSSIRYKNIGDTYNYVKAITEEFRGLAMELNLGIWSATQSVRGQANSSDISLTDVSESFGLAHTADFILGVTETDDLREKNKYYCKVLKSRYAKINSKSRFLIGVDKDKQKLYELDDPHGGLVQEDEESTNNNMGGSKFDGTRKKTFNTDGWQIQQ